LIGKIRPGQTVERARAEVDMLCASFRKAFPDMPDSKADLDVVPLERYVSATVRPALLTLAAAVGFVLLIACVNVSNLLLARATSRQQEIGIRRALGAGRGRLIRQFLTETLLLSFVGGSVGVALAAAALPLLLQTLAPGTLPVSYL